MERDVINEEFAQFEGGSRMEIESLSDHNVERIGPTQAMRGVPDDLAVARTDWKARRLPSAVPDGSKPLAGDLVQPYAVLMVEDSAEYAHVLSEVLELANPGAYHITVESCLEAALNRLTQERCDVILLDLGLPDSHGLQTLVSVASKAQRVPIIVLTAVEEGSMAFECLESGAHAYIAKGEVDPSSLSALVLRAASAHGEGNPAQIEENGNPDRAGIGGVSSKARMASVAEESVPAPVQGVGLSNPQSDPALYHGQVAIELISPGGVAQTVAFLARIRKETGLRVVLQTGSQRNTTLVVKLVAPSRLKESLLQMDGVDAVRHHGNSPADARLVVTLS